MIKKDDNVTIELSRVQVAIVFSILIKTPVTIGDRNFAAMCDMVRKMEAILKENKENDNG